ncbi:MAG: hypothetical protein RI988_1906 [Pseudomonadota bacterium]
MNAPGTAIVSRQSAVSQCAQWKLTRAACAGFGLAVASWVAQAQGSVGADPPRNVISLAASVAAEVTMDTLSVTLSAMREASDAAEVQTQLSGVVEAALAALRPASRAAQIEVRTGGFSIGPRYGQRGTVTGWSGRAEVVLEGRDVTAVSRLAARAPGLTVSRVAFSLSRAQRERVEAEVSAQAIALFRERALQHAQAFGFTGYVIREVQVAMPEPPRFMPMPTMRVAASPGSGGDEAIPVEAGKATVGITVSGSLTMTR